VPTSTRFAVATHILATIALARGEVVRSEAIARSVNTNAAFVRRLLGSLAEAGLTTSQMGQGGGALLAKPAENITLFDVYRAVEEPSFFTLHHGGPSQLCPIGKNITPVLEEEFAGATAAIKRALSKTTVADVARRVEARAGGAAIRRVLGGS
jgi:Rrf2 family protein